MFQLYESCFLSVYFILFHCFSCHFAFFYLLCHKKIIILHKYVCIQFLYIFFAVFEIHVETKKPKPGCQKSDKAIKWGNSLPKSKPSRFRCQTDVDVQLHFSLLRWQKTEEFECRLFVQTFNNKKVSGKMGQSEIYVQMVKVHQWWILRWKIWVKNSSTSSSQENSLLVKTPQYQFTKKQFTTKQYTVG
jgi:hypothetical protein